MDEKAKHTAVEYLNATIQTAEWISSAYKDFAATYKDDEKLLLEVFLCICEKVPLDFLCIAEQKEPVLDSFNLCRRKHVESDILKKYSEDLEKIKAITEETENEIRSMSGTVKQIAEVIPSFDEMFPPIEQPEIIDENSTVDEKIEEQGGEKTISDVKPNSEQEEENEKTPCFQEKDGPVSKEVHKDSFGTKLLDGFKNISIKLKKSPSEMVIDMLAKGYSDEQINFALSCIDEGMTMKELDSFMDPKISVGMMMKLRDMKIKEDKKHG